MIVNMYIYSKIESVAVKTVSVRFTNYIILSLQIQGDRQYVIVKPNKRRTLISLLFLEAA